MKKVYLTIAALLTWAMTSVAALAVDIIVVSHGQANDPFWSVAKNGVDKACKDMKVSCKYTAPATFDMVEMAKLIDNAVSQKPKKRPSERSLGLLNIFFIYNLELPILLHS